MDFHTFPRKAEKTLRETILTVNALSVPSCSKRAPSMTIFEHAQIYVRILTTLTSQVLVYFGKEGLLSDTPFMNLTTKGWLPAGVLSGKTMTVDSALRAVIKQLYPMPE